MPKLKLQGNGILESRLIRTGLCEFGAQSPDVFTPILHVKGTAKTVTIADAIDCRVVCARAERIRVSLSVRDERRKESYLRVVILATTRFLFTRDKPSEYPSGKLIGRRLLLHCNSRERSAKGSRPLVSSFVTSIRMLQNILISAIPQCFL